MQHRIKSIYLQAERKRGKNSVGQSFACSLRNCLSKFGKIQGICEMHKSCMLVLGHRCLSTALQHSSCTLSSVKIVEHSPDQSHLATTSLTLKEYLPACLRKERSDQRRRECCQGTPGHDVSARARTRRASMSETAVRSGDVERGGDSIYISYTWFHSLYAYEPSDLSG